MSTSRFKLHLGKQPARRDDRDIMLGAIIDHAALPAHPKYFGNESKMPLPRLMLGNGPDDSVQPGFQGAGDCVFAMIINFVRLSCAIGGKPIPPFTGKEAIDAYSEVTHYVIGDDSTDNGTDMRTALNWFRKTGIKDANGVRHKLGAYAAIDLANVDKEFEALYLMGVGNACGIQFLASAMDEFDAGKPWSKTGGQSEGGHAILWDAHRKYEYAETWAKDQPVTAHFMKSQLDEAYALFTEDMLVDGNAPCGLKGDVLKSLLKQL